MRGSVGTEQTMWWYQESALYPCKPMDGSVLRIMLMHPGCSLVPRASHPSICRL